MNSRVGRLFEKRIFRERGRACERCGWNEMNPFQNYVPTQIDHINGNNKDHRPENLIVLCPNCHSLTEHFMFGGKHHKKRKRVNQYG